MARLRASRIIVVSLFVRCWEKWPTSAGGESCRSERGICRLGKQPIAEGRDQRLADPGLRHEQIVVQVQFDHLRKRQPEHSLRQVVDRIREPAERNSLTRSAACNAR